MSLRRMRRLHAPLLVGVGVAVGVALVRWQLGRLFIEQAPYEVERRIGRIEIRRYPSIVVAQTTVRGTPWRQALDEGFRRLADYIFGRGASASEKIAMTAPVLSLGSGDAQTVQFVMPRGRALASLPSPRDPRVELRALPSRLVAAYRFRGLYEARRVRAKERELLEGLERAGVPTRGEVVFAGFDPPWTLPFLRRVEAWVELPDG